MDGGRCIDKVTIYIYGKKVVRSDGGRKSYACTRHKSECRHLYNYPNVNGIDVGIIGNNFCFVFLMFNLI